MKLTRILSQKTIHEAALFDVVENTLRYPTGRRVVHNDVYRHPTVTVFPVTESGEVYLIKEQRYLLNKTCLEAMAGFINKGETPEEAARRELKEEMGITATSVEFICTVDMAASVIHAQSHIFIARGLTFGEQELEEDEIIEIIKMPFEEAVQKVISGEITTATSIIGILRLKEIFRK